MTAAELTGVRKSYGDVHALDGVDLRIEPGELVAVLGPNGAGKTTTFELLLGLTRPSAGQVRVLGSPPGSRDVVSRLGAMLQSAGFQECITVRELVRIIGRSYPQSRSVDDVLERVGLTNRRDRMLTDLSGGERQRLLLAAAIVGSPELLVLDEPTAAMDVEARSAFWREARASVTDGATLIFATHDLAEADEVAERVVILRAGRVVADATPALLKQRVHSKVAQFVTDLPPVRIRGMFSDAVHEIADYVDGQGWAVRTHTQDPAHLVSLLVAHGHRVDDLTVRDADLEDAFVQLTSADSLMGEHR